MLALGMAALLVANLARATVSFTIASGGLEPFNVAIDGTSINNALAGGILISQPSSPTPDASLPLTYYTVCTDIGGTLYLGSTYTYNSPASFTGLSGVNPTWGSDNAGKTSATADLTSASQAIQNAAELFYTHESVLTAVGSTTDKAALQLAVWDALYNTDAGGKLTGGRFTFGGGDAAAVSEANAWLGDLTTATYTGDLFVPNPLDQGNSDGEPPQELLYGISPAPLVVAVPETTTIIAGLLLLLPLGASTIRIIRVSKK